MAVLILHKNAIKLIKASKLTSFRTRCFTKAFVNIPVVGLISKGNSVIMLVIRGLLIINILLLNNSMKMENFQFQVKTPFFFVIIA